MLDSECKLKGLDKPHYFNRWINLKVLFQGAFKGRKCNLRKAVEVSGLKWTGRAHCGLDDAMNTAKLAVELMRRGTILTVTGSLETGSLVTKIRRPQWPGMGLEAKSEKCNISESVKNSVGAVNDAQSSLGSANRCAVLKQPSSVDAQISAGPVNDLQEANKECEASKLPSAVDVQCSVKSLNVGMNTLLCYCGVICKRHSIQKQGPMHGKHFLACGKWTPSEGSRCGFFEWAIS
ncbi:hypothetical protein L7F22_011430 [Adiantum nelumboides]|nr:hypothetical protein [Adiantum nelumboides]